MSSLSRFFPFLKRRLFGQISASRNSGAFIQWKLAPKIKKSVYIELIWLYAGIIIINNHSVLSTQILTYLFEISIIRQWDAYEYSIKFVIISTFWLRNGFSWQAMYDRGIISCWSEIAHFPPGLVFLSESINQYVCISPFP